MLMINQHAGFGGRRYVAPNLRHVGQYAMTFTASATSSTVTVQLADLAAQNATKQILVLFRSELGLISSMTIDGVTARRVSTAVLAADFFYIDYTGTGPFNIVGTLTGAVTETGAVDVFEIINAAPLHRGMATGIFGAGASLVINNRVPKDGLVAAGAAAFVDTTTFTWGAGVTEINDADVGGYRASTAANTTPASAAAFRACDVTLSGSDTLGHTSLAILPTIGHSSAQCLNVSSVAAVTTTATFSDAFTTDYTGCGSFTLYLGILWEGNATITGVTRGGVSMTSVGSVVNTTATPDLGCAVFKIAVTTAAPTGTIVITFSASIDTLLVRVYPIRVYNPGTDGTVQTVTGNGTGTAVSVTVKEGGLIVALTARGTASQVPAWTGVINFQPSVSGAYSVGAGVYPHATAETSRSINATNAGGGEFATLAFAID